ncbi:MAG: pyridoxamine 5'-phosphate oxidase [Bacteroidetes bacterium]|jgi:pyridoxamine 5'-phosphate oxidase|nr:pyridoxamine 5'-phosphate oxidase [Bacteroidota bacterium]MDF1866074.1 pyridoxamine 5'-phosphate oxidase [Saprospiraceae bacterium]
MNRDILPTLRETYNAPIFGENDLPSNPLAQFQLWFNDALSNKIKEPNAMTLATCTKEGKPSARIVLLKGLDENGFIFYTNYLSRKAEDIKENPNVALVFLWLEIHRQVRIEGHIEMVSKEISETYFQSRPKGSQIGAWASPQSQVIQNRNILEENVSELEKKYKETAHLPLPKFWGGYRVIPEVVEFWQGQPSRLHDRLRYSKNEDNDWQVERLAP